MQNGRVQLPNPVAPSSDCISKGLGSILGGSGGGFNFGSLMGGNSAVGGSHSHSKRQEIPAWMQVFLPKIAVFVGGGGSVGSGSAFAVSNTVSEVRSGAYVAKGDTFQFSSEIINYDPVDKDIYLTLDFEWVPGKVNSLHDVGMGAVNLDCGTFAFQPPKDKPVTYTGAKWTMTQDGYFVNFTPHLHDGGTHIKVFLNGMSS
jgi:hypothetical protein